MNDHAGGASASNDGLGVRRNDVEISFAFVAVWSDGRIDCAGGVLDIGGGKPTQGKAIDGLGNSHTAYAALVHRRMTPNAELTGTRSAGYRSQDERHQ